MKTELTKKTLTDDIFHVPNEFKAITENSGRAEFVVCPIIKRGKIREIFIYPLNQPEAKHYFHVKNKKGWKGLRFGTLSLKDNRGIQQPDVWKTFYSKTHKCLSFQFYVPLDSKSFFLYEGLGSLCFGWL